MGTTNPLELMAKTISELLAQIAQEAAVLAPKIFFTIIILIVIAVIARLTHKYMDRLLKAIEVDRLLEGLLGKTLPLSASRAILIAIDIGFIFLALLSIFNLLIPEEAREFVNSLMISIGKIAGVLIVAVIVIGFYGILVERIKIEAKLKSYLFFMSFLIVTALLIDIATLSSEVKAALVSGLSIGIGLSIALFALWFFFGDYLERLTLMKERKGRE